MLAGRDVDGPKGKATGHIARVGHELPSRDVPAGAMRSGEQQIASPLLRACGQIVKAPRHPNLWVTPSGSGSLPSA